MAHNGLGIAEEVAFEKRKFNLVMKLNRNTKVQHLQSSHFFGNTLLCVRSFLSWLWNCRIWKFHTWTCNHDKGIPPTKEQLQNGVAGFYDYAKMYCDRCSIESKISKQTRCKYKN